MPGAESTIVLLPRFTTLSGLADTDASQFTTLPLDVSRFGSVQFQLWRGPLHDYADGSPQFTLFIEESLDTEIWTLGATESQTKVLDEGHHYFSYAFRMRWFRLKVNLSGNEPMVTCWAEGILR